MIEMIFWVLLQPSGDLFLRLCDYLYLEHMCKEVPCAQPRTFSLAHVFSLEHR